MLAEKAIYSTRQTVRREEQYFWFFQNIFKLPISISSFFQWYDIIYCSNSAFPWISNSVVINLFFKKYIYLSVSPGYFHQSDQLYENIGTTFMLSYFMEFFLDICFCLFLFVALLRFCCCFCSFLFRFPFWPKF